MRTVEDAGPYKMPLKSVRQQTYKQEFEYRFTVFEVRKMHKIQ